jgi:hypothetical protein
MTIPKIRDEFFIVENFIDKETCATIIKYLNFITENKMQNWDDISFYGSHAIGYAPSDKTLEKFGLPEDFFEITKQRIKAKLEDLLGFEVSQISFHAQRWVDGAFADYHSDNSDENGNPTAFEKSKYAVFIYLNDDFNGGHLKFKNQEINIKPEVGLGVFFAGGHTREHMVTTVRGGTRYTIGSFWDDARIVYTDEQREAWDIELKKVREIQKVQFKEWATPEGKPGPISPEEHE